MRRVVIDPGHGGGDPGAVGKSGLREADVNLLVANLVVTLLASVVDVAMTRTDDSTVDLNYRPAYANSIDAEAYISIHCNAASNPAAHGTETYSYPEAPNGKILATAIHQHVVAALGLTDRGLKEADFCVLRDTNMAAALAELAFISNPDEERLLADPVVQLKAARAIAEGIAEYLGVQLQPEEIILTAQDYRMIDGRTYAPVRSLCDQISKLVDVPLVVSWNEERQSVEIRKG